MSSPEGQIIGNPSKPWTIGRLLGNGACGSVHELVAPPGSKSSSRAYAVKVAPLPKYKPAAKSGKKRKKTAEERNADLILHEYTTLQNAAEMRGRMVPDIPLMGSPPACGETVDKKFRYLVMERMAAPLSEVIPALLGSHSASKGGGTTKIPMGNVAVAMLNCIQAMHAKGWLFVDIKPENFMLGENATSKRIKSSPPNVSERVRLIDFGLVEMFSEMSSSRHRENAVPDAPLVGTPSYASLNVMSGHTVSRRDDLEALGYVVSELILMLVSYGTGSSTRRKDKDEHVLPWSHAGSDRDLRLIKLQEMDKNKRSKSKLFAALKEAGADTVMGNYFLEVQGLGYAEKPDYDSLRCYLRNLVVTVGNNEPKKTFRTTAKEEMKGSAHRRRKHEKSPVSDTFFDEADENVENRKAIGKKQRVSVAKESVARRSARRGRNTAKTREMGTQTDKVEVVYMDSSEDEEMDWEATPDNHRKGILKLEIVEGPHQGQSIFFGGDCPHTVLIGGDPHSHAIKDAFKFALSEDNDAIGALAKVVLTSNKNLHSARMTNMSSSSDVRVKGSSLAKGKSRQAFVGDKIKMGGTLLQIRKVA